jgi:hypothetical protein
MYCVESGANWWTAYEPVNPARAVIKVFLVATQGGLKKVIPAQHLSENVKALVRLHKAGQLGGEIMPEDVLLETVSGPELLNVLTLGMALNYQRNAYALWRSVLSAHSDESARWVFDPSEVVARSPEDVAAKLLEHRVALQPNRHPSIWRRVAEGIVNSSERRDVAGMLDSFDLDVAKTKQAIQSDRKSEFPYLSGPKIFNYWLYVMESYGKIDWASRDMITIAPDTHILQATVRLGVCGPEVLEGTAAMRELVSERWVEALAGLDLAPIDLHTPLWLWSRLGLPDLQSPSAFTAGGGDRLV